MLKALRAGNETKQRTATKKTPRASGVFFVCDIIEVMSIKFKNVLATIAVVIVVPVSFLGFLGSAFNSCFGGPNNIYCNYIANWTYLLIPALEIIFYIRYLKTKSEVYFWITTLPLLIVLIYLIKTI